MVHPLKTPEGGKLYVLRERTQEPVFGIIKAVPDSVHRRCAGRKSATQEEPCDRGLEYKADVRPQPRLTEPKRSQTQPQRKTA
jgi:hypothetical protein